MMLINLSGGKSEKIISYSTCFIFSFSCVWGSAEEETVEEPVAVEEAETLDAPATTVAETLDKITFGFVPSAEQAELLDNIQPLMNVLSEGLGIEVEGFVTSDYSGLLVAMGSGQADVGAFNTLGYVNALNAFPTRLEAIAKVVRYGSGSYHGTFYTSDSSVCKSEPVIGAFENIDGVQTLVTGTETTAPAVAALQVGWTFGDSGLIPDGEISPGYACEADLSVMVGEEVLFVEEGSTSGYLYPSLQLKNLGIDYTSDITQVFAGSHDGVIAGIYNGDAKFGVAYDDARRTLRKTNNDVGEKVIAIGITAEIPNDVVAVRSDLPEDVKAKIYQILSDYIQTDEGLAVMDDIYGWTDIVPAVNSEFDVVKQAAEEFGLYDE
jgi:phosphonate transport system substrate-binding protein